MKKEYIRIALAYVGVIVGAGLSSGQDIMQYFLSYGIKGIIGIVVLGILNIIFGGVMLTLGSYYQSDNHQDVLARVAGPVTNRLIDITLIFAAFVMGFVMVAGAGANLNQQFGVPAWLGALICSALVIIVSFLDFDKITGVLGIFTPVIIVMILMATAYTFIGKSYDFQFLDQTARTIEPAISSLWLSVLNYFALCAVNGVSMAFVLGGSVVRIGNAQKGGVVGGVLIGMIVTCAAITLFANIGDVKEASIPLLMIMNSIHPVVGFIYTLVIFALIFNTVFSLYYSTAKRFGKGDLRRTRIVLAGIVLAGYVCSFGGFKQLLGFMYPVLGYMGILILVVLFAGWIRNFASIREEKYLRRHMIRVTLKQLVDASAFTQKDREMLDQLSEASVVDATSLKDNVKDYAEHLVDSMEDVSGYVEAKLPVRKSTKAFVEQLEGNE